MLITADNLAADGGPPGNEPSLTFHVLKSPEFGELRLQVTTDETGNGNDSPSANSLSVVYRSVNSNLVRLH